MTASWRQIVMLNYEANAAVLSPYIPKGVELDLWRNRAYVSLVGFRFLNTRVLRIPIPFHRNFDEVNLRFYVRRGERRGVVFIREIVPRRAVAWVARAVYRENYVRLPMRNKIDATQVEYAWRFAGRWNRVVVSQFGPRIAPAPGSHEEFIAEHYWGYARRSANVIVEYRVEHEPWHVQPSPAGLFEGSVAGLYPRAFEFLDSRTPDSAFLADGSFIAVFPGKRLDLR